ncbi:MAG: cysteine desulfurase [Spirochaetota bacterium]|nr:cysteine desulfurase [Spirochaetota bacterium]
MNVYLDNNATTPLDPRVKKVMIDAFDLYGNPSSIHEMGRRCKFAIDDCRKEIASFLGAEPSEIIFTSGATEANNMVLKGVLLNNNLTFEGNHIITTKIEHSSILNVCKSLELKGVSVSYLSVDKHGIINIDELEGSICSNTKLISIIYANNEIGTIQPLENISEIAKKHGIPLHTDAVQAIGKIPVNVNALGIDFMSISGHKFYAPKGIGVLYNRKKHKLNPLIEGGSHEKGRRAGTENVLGIIGLAEAFRCLKKDMNDDFYRIKKLRDKLEKGILENIPNVKLNGHPEKRLPGTSNLSFITVEGSAILLKLDMQGIYVSTGSACQSELTEPSHVITALGEGIETARSSVRFSVGRLNTDIEIDYSIKNIIKVVKELRFLTAVI